MTMVLRRLAAAALLVACCGAFGAFVFRPGGNGGGASGTPSITTFTLVNTSGSTQAAPFVTPMFGAAFKEGDIPSGHAPQFLIGGTAQSFSWSCLASGAPTTNYASSSCAAWPDGSLKFAGVEILDASTSIAGNGSLTVTVTGGGSAPSASSRTTTDLYNQSIVTTLTGAGASFGLSGTTSAWLDNNGSGGTNQSTPLLLMDGGAGKTWSVRARFATSEGGTPDGYLEETAYVSALNNGSGTLGGFRFLPRVAQPWYNPSAGVASAAMRAVGDGTLAELPFFEYGAGPTKVHFPWLATSQYHFTCCTSGNILTTTASNNFYQGGNTAGGYDTYGAIVTNAGTTGLSTSTLYFLQPVGSSTTQFRLLTSSSATGFVVPAADASGNAVIDAVPVVEYFGGLFGATTTAKWNYFAGTGTGLGASDPTVIVQYSANYLHSTQLVPPWNINQIGAGTAYPVADNNTFSYNWNPLQFGPLYQGLETPGQRLDIGPETGWAAADFYNQSANDDYLIRMIGLAANLLNYDLRDQASDYPPIMRPTTGNGNYTGVPVSNTADVYQAAAVGQGDITLPPDGVANGWFSEGGPSHMPEMAYYAYLKTGEPEYLDLLVEQMEGTSIYMGSSVSNQTTGTCQGYRMAATYVNPNDFRTAAWIMREQVLAAGIAPAVWWDGSQFSTYLRDLEAGDTAFMNCEITNQFSSIYGSYPASVGLWTIYQPFTGQFEGTGGTGFMVEFWYWVMAQAAAIDSDANALAYLENTLPTWINHAYTTFGGRVMTPEYSKMANAMINGEFYGTAMITSDQGFGIWMQGCFNGTGSANELTWKTSAPAFAYTPNATCPINNGDRIIFSTGFNDSGTMPACSGSTGCTGGAMNADTPYYITNLTSGSGGSYSFDLSPTCATSAAAPGSECSNGGSAVTIAAAGGPVANDHDTSWASPIYEPAVPVSAATFGANSTTCCGMNGYVVDLLGALEWARAVGASNTNLSATIGYQNSTLNAYWGSAASVLTAAAAQPYLFFQPCYYPTVCTVP
jgi:hypothetical protein